MATAAGTIVALYYSNKAVRSAEAAKLEGLSDSTIEIMNLFYKTLALLRDAKKATTVDDFKALAPKVQLNFEILRMVVTRPTLTDGGIAVGVGSMELLKAIMAQAAEWQQPINAADPARMMPDHLQATDDILKEVVERAEGVDAYAIRNRWPKWQRRMERIKRNTASS
ncbi:hypothetical protein ASD54_25350 [Rhizobium sp. Root149]|nr:hypothetical protein ASD54_25350 [Rhizobium sp. Root149]